MERGLGDMHRGASEAGEMRRCYEHCTPAPRKELGVEAELDRTRPDTFS